MRILLFGDNSGIPQLLHHLQSDVVVGIVGASIRPQYIDELQVHATSCHVQFLIQPKWKSDTYNNFVDDVHSLAPDLIWVNSYSMILRDDVLACARLGGVNIHPALLPRNRGCNPTQWAIMNGEHETGVTLHEIDSGLDTGPIIDYQKVPILFEDSWLDVHQRLEKATDALITKNIPNLYSGYWSSVLQKNTQATIGRRRTPEDGEFSWTQPLVEIYNIVRALLPPLPPAFYQDNDGQKFSLKSQQTIWQLALLRYGLNEASSMQEENIVLRPFQATDANLLYDLTTDFNFAINRNPLFPVLETNYEDWVDHLIATRSDFVVFVIEEQHSHQAIGICDLSNINWFHGSAELQIRINQTIFQGCGYGSEAVRLLCEFGFKDLSLHRIYSYLLVSDQRAIKMHQKCGFECEGTLKDAAYVDSILHDVALMAKLR